MDLDDDAYVVLVLSEDEEEEGEESPAKDEAGLSGRQAPLNKRSHKLLMGEKICSKILVRNHQKRKISQSKLQSSSVKSSLLLMVFQTLIRSVC